MSEPAPEQPVQRKEEEHEGMRSFYVTLPPGAFRPKCDEGKHDTRKEMVPCMVPIRNARVRAMKPYEACTDCKRTPKEIKKQRRQLFWKKVRKAFLRFFKRSSR